MSAELNELGQPKLSLRERMENVQARRRAFHEAKMQHGIIGAVDLLFGDIDSEKPKLIGKYIDLSGCED